jgi:hypothetical protein
MPPDFEIVDIPPDLQPLFSALAKCDLSTRIIVQTVDRLIKPPESLRLPGPDCTEPANSIIKTIVDFDGDMAARMLRLNEDGPYPEATWKALTAAERKRAKRLWEWALDPGLDTAPQGRPSKIDPALVLYCARLLREASGESRFKFSRPPTGGRPGGPRWRALIMALQIAQASLTRAGPVLANRADGTASQELSAHAEIIAEIVNLDRRSKLFAAYCGHFGLGSSTANDVAEHPAMFRYSVMLARALRRRRSYAVP